MQGGGEEAQMGNWLRGARFAGAAAVLMTALQLSPIPTASGAEAYKAQRTADGKADLNGIWQALNTANWDLQEHAARPGVVVALGAAGAVPAGLSVVEGDEIPYLPAAAAKKKENFENRLTADPEIKCYLPGVPRATYMPYPFQIVQSSAKIQMAYTFTNAARTIHLDKVAGPPDDTWMGHSVGRWEGDTLVVDVTHFNDKTWFDRAGNFHSDALHVVERFTPITPDALRYEATIEDPKVFTRPWKIAMPIYRRLEPNIQILEYPCIDFAEEFLYGHLRKQQLVRHWERETIEDPKVFTRPWKIAMPIYRRLEPNIQLLDYPCIDFAEEFLYGHLRKQQLVRHWEGETIEVDIKRKVPPGERLYEWYGK